MGKRVNPAGGGSRRGTELPWSGAHSIPDPRALAQAGLWVLGRGGGEAIKARAPRRGSGARGRGSANALPPPPLPSRRRQGGRARFRGWAGRRRGRRTGFSHPSRPQPEGAELRPAPGGGRWSAAQPYLSAERTNWKPGAAAGGGRWGQVPPDAPWTRCVCCCFCCSWG